MSTARLYQFIQSHGYVILGDGSIVEPKHPSAWWGR